ncbi:hypothetical protein M2323_002371 [Rhodoblastus acidophilus]|uniref:hypothetical protein n=1 Tax=Rhodoblastus acidophilus TaxID=1074 RepID=UPI002224986D|nr:hypothetical protein [Rhodoblastus acidophilus]MCW2286351.1 hypothetical protein [Rhodoblastus acidophilus]MCW2333437.1 hypothetical protein [Rhodoblastus acidophilus]
MFLRAHPLAFRTPLLLAGAVALAAPLVFFFAPAQAPETTAATAPLAYAEPAHGESATRSYAYYPEQLAALSSLNSFAPAADPGRPASAAPAPGPTAAPPARPPVRPAETRRAEPRAVARPAQPAAPAAEPAHNEDWKVFGLAVPRPSWPDTKGLREKAAGWGEAAASLPDKAMAGVSRLWRGPDAELKTPASANPPARTN